ncbi:hypothetical protein B0O80DRAFT_503113 [Mortierella sp. GBAus27b]|nr:hypothetical protein B0O80DRAFT_503113 [Mortierella sp. GBAus27b]
MTDASPKVDFRQEFRVVSGPSSTAVNNSTIFIGSRLDKTGERIVLWRDIQTVVKKADHVMCGNTLISFMTDDDFKELDPQRILYHPGVVLDVIVEGQVPEANTSTPTENQVGTAAMDLDYSTNDNDGLASTIRHVDNLSINPMEDVVTQSVNAERGQKLIQRHGWPPIAQQTGKVAGMQIKGLDMDDPILKQLMGMGVTSMTNNDIYHIYTIRMLHQMINQQVIIENKLQAIMQQNYELHEYPIPRLFIVLPKPKRRRDRMTHPLSKQFRLYFLCECGDHTIGAGRGNLPNKIHLAKHGGYDLDQPNEFFQRYGSYVLTMMKFVKYGVMAAGIAVPPLAIFKVVEGIETIQKSLGMTLDKVGSLVDETIKHIQEMEKHTEIGGSATAGPMRLDDIEALEGADLRQLQLYLNEKDKGRVLGDLFRIFTPDGHVKWVCIEHFKENYRKAAMQRFKDIITANGAMFLQDTVMIRLGSTTLANQFYEAMVKAQGVRNLDITLEWDVTLGDLEALESAVTRANILQLEISGVYFKGPRLSLLNNSRRYNPILGLMCNSRLEELSLRNFDHFFQRIDVSSMVISTHLRKFNLFSSMVKSADMQEFNLFAPKDEAFSEPSLYGRHCKANLKNLLKRCPSLEELWIDVSDVDKAYEDLTEDTSILPEKLTIQINQVRVFVEVSQGKIQSVKTEIKSREGYYSIVPFLRRGHLTELEMELGSEDSSMTRLVDVLLWNPNIRNVTVMGWSLEQAITNTITSARMQILLDRGSCELRQGKITFKQLGELFSVFLEFQDGLPQPIVSSYCQMLGDDHQLYRRVFQLFGWSFTTLITDMEFNDDLASVLDRITEKYGSKINWLSLDTTTLRVEGFKCVKRVIDRSQDLQRFHLVIPDMNEEYRRTTFKNLIHRYGKRLTGLALFGRSPKSWMPIVMALCPTRDELPELEDLGLFNDGVGDLPLDGAHWIARMASRSSHLPSAPPQDRSNIVSATSGHNKGSLELLDLGNISLQYPGWEVVVKALDFSILRTLYIGKGFSVDDLALLVDRIPLNTNPVDKLDISIMDEPFEAGIRTEWDAHITKLFANRNVREVEDSYYWSASRFWAHFANLSRVGAADDTGHDN